MKRQDREDLLRAFHRLMTSAEAFVNRAPKLKRIDAERAALLEALSDAQLVLSVQRLPEESKEKRHDRPSADHRPTWSDEALKRVRATLEELHRRLGPVADDLEAMEDRARRAQSSIESSLRAAQSQTKDAA